MIAGVGKQGAVQLYCLGGRQLRAVLRQLEQAFQLAAHQAVQGRCVNGIHDEPIEGRIVEVTINFDFKLDRFGSADHCALRHRAAHGVIVVLNEPQFPQLNAPLLGQSRDLVEIAGCHACRQKGQRTGSRIVAVQIGALVGNQPPGPTGFGRAH